MRPRRIRFSLGTTQPTVFVFRGLFSRGRSDRSMKLHLECSLNALRWRSWLRHHATRQKVEGSVPDEVVGFFGWPKLFQPHHGLGVDSASWQKWVPGIFLGGKGRPTRKADNLTDGPPRPVTGVALRNFLTFQLGLERFRRLFKVKWVAGWWCTVNLIGERGVGGGRSRVCFSTSYEVRFKL
jgi:hypothetical protein